MNRFEAPSGTARRTSKPHAGALRQQAFRLHPIAAALLLLAGNTWYGPGGAQAQTLPTGAQVVHGQATVSTIGNQMTVTSSANAALNWQSFSVGAANSVRFDQPSASSQVLNRVVGNDPSNILGSISSNGKVWLLNPNGILFGRDARVDVAGLVASTLNISNADWQAQQLRLRAGGGAGAADATLVNQGNIRSTTGGNILLIGGQGGVRNEGLIEAQGGQITLAAGSSVDLVDEGLPNLAVRVAAPQGEALNLGALAAGAGQIDIQAAIVNQNGIVWADSVDGSGGTVVLRASEALNTSANSITTANGVTGGRVTADSQGGTSLVAGSIESTGSTGRGGQVKLLGKQVGVLDGARVTASSGAGGGEVFVGGGLQGKDAQIPNAESTFIARGAALSADATDKGDGGRVIVWSNQATRAYGQFSARGGSAGGNGGFIETSGGWLDARPASIRTDAPRGRAGEWLLDPDDLTITTTSVAGDINITSGPDFTTVGDPALLTTQTIVTALNAGNNVSITTSTGGSGAGDIFLSSADITANPSSAVSLTLNAQGDIRANNSTIASTGAPLDVTFNAAGSGTGAIRLDGTTINTAGAIISGVARGNIDLGGGGLPIGPNISATGTPGAFSADFNGIYIGPNSNLNAGSGRISARGYSTAQNPDSFVIAGVLVESGSTLNAADIALTGWIDSNGALDRFGVDVSGTLTATHSISLNGLSNSGAFNPDYLVWGVRASGGINLHPQAADPTASLQIRGVTNDVAKPSSVLSYLSRAGTGLQGNVAVGGGATVQISGTDLSPNNDFGVLIPGNVDLSGAGGAAFVSDRGSLQLSGSLLTPNNAPIGFTSEESVYIFLPSDIIGSPSEFNISAGTTAGFGSVGTPYAVRLTGNVPISVQAQDVLASTNNPIEISTGGPISIQANIINLLPGTVFSSTATGDAITVTGLGGSSNVANFYNNAGSTALSAPNGRWLVYATDPSNADSFNAGGLLHDFRQYNAVAGSAAPLGTGNGLLFSVNPKLAISTGDRPQKTYDGSSTIMVSDRVTGEIDGDTIVGRFEDPNAGINRTIKVFIASGNPASNIATGIDKSGKPVYGYLPADNVFTLVGNIDQAQLTLSGVSAENKIYDGTTTAAFSGGSLSGLVGTEVVGIGVTGQFDDKNVGVGKAVSGIATLVDGSNGGLAGNYVLTSNVVTTAANITPKTLTLSGVDAANKAYDGTTAAVLSGGTVSGLVGTETVGIAATGQFDNKNVGTGKTVSGTAALVDGSNGGLAGNYVLASNAFTTTADVTPKALTLSGVSAANKTYDGTTAAVLSGGTVSGLVGNETLGIAATGQFDNKNAGTGKTVSGTAALVDGSNGGQAGNYVLASNAVTTTADVTPKALTLTSVNAANKIYDGTTAAVLSGGLVAGLVGAETVGIAATGQFNDKNVGTSKAVSGTATLVDGSNGGLAGNYVLTNNAVATTASIAPAVLTYQATPTTRGQGEPLGIFTGSVTGFVASETQQSAATGTLAFVSPASPASPAGSYAINGTGLSADNYTFTQAPSNATALTLVPAARETTPPEARVQPVIPPVVLTTPTQGRALDVVQALRVSVDGGTAFGSLDVSGMSLDELASVLEARNRYKQSLLAEGTTKLESNPALADAPPCTTLEQADSGTCLLTEELKAKVQAAKANATTDVAVAPSKDPAVPRQGSKPTAAAAATAGPVAAPAAPLSRPIIRNAALPQIQRKFAVIIGIDNYSDGRIPKLDNAQSDASAVADVLGSKLGYETTVINDGSREAILRRLNRLVTQVGPHDSVVVYYAGHGTVVDKTGLGYWLPANADASRPETWISNSDISKLLSQFSASQVALISDSCFSGSLVSDERIRTSAQTADAATLLGRRAAVVMSSGGNEPVSDSGKEGHSVFSWNLMRTLEKVSAWRPGANVFEQVRFAVARQLPQRPAYGAARAGGHQAGADYVFEQRQFDGIGP